MTEKSDEDWTPKPNDDGTWRVTVGDRVLATDISEQEAYRIAAAPRLYDFFCYAFDMYRMLKAVRVHEPVPDPAPESSE